MSALVFTLFLSLYCGDKINVPIKYNSGHLKASFNIDDKKFSAKFTLRF